MPQERTLCDSQEFSSPTPWPTALRCGLPRCALAGQLHSTTETLHEFPNEHRGKLLTTQHHHAHFLKPAFPQYTNSVHFLSAGCSLAPCTHRTCISTGTWLPRLEQISWPLMGMYYIFLWVLGTLRKERTQQSEHIATPRLSSNFCPLLSSAPPFSKEKKLITFESPIKKHCMVRVFTLQCFPGSSHTLSTIKPNNHGTKKTPTLNKKKKN